MALMYVKNCSLVLILTQLRCQP